MQHYLVVVRNYWWRILHLRRVIHFIIYVIKFAFSGGNVIFRPGGLRFLEIKMILEEWLSFRLSYRKSLASEICAQFHNVLSKCDSITYDEDGAADAYVVLHFLDRYHRFQLIFDALRRQKVMPRRGPVRVLDIGTGPGPSMFATSDFYRKSRWRFARPTWNEEKTVEIDYVERSSAFRNWLHFFTELANSTTPSGVAWDVPYHHGTFYDFADLQFDRSVTNHEWDEDGDIRRFRSVHRIRPDLVIMSNFLTTEAQARIHFHTIRECARNLRHNGIIVVVGAKSSSRKYQDVYEIVDRAILGVRFSRTEYKAWCEKLVIDQADFRYRYSDEWGFHLKDFLAGARRKISAALSAEASASAALPDEIEQKLVLWSSEEYDHEVSWEVRVYRKIAIPRRGRGASRTSRRQSATRGNSRTLLTPPTPRAHKPRH